MELTKDVSASLGYFWLVNAYIWYSFQLSLQMMTSMDSGVCSRNHLSSTKGFVEMQTMQNLSSLIQSKFQVGVFYSDL